MICALFAFGYLFGFVGLLIAVPLATAIWSHHARRGACETGAASHGAGSGRTSCERNVDHDGAWGSRRNTRERRPFARHGDAVYGIDCPCYGRAVRTDRLPRVFPPHILDRCEV